VTSVYICVVALSPVTRKCCNYLLDCLFIHLDNVMEKALKKEMDDVMSQPSVTGVMCVDSDGLCVAAHGSASKTSSGLVAAVASQAAGLRPNNPAPVVVLETDVGTTLIKSHSGTTVAICKSGTTRKDTNSTTPAEVNRWNAVKYMTVKTSHHSPCLLISEWLLYSCDCDVSGCDSECISNWFWWQLRRKILCSWNTLRTLKKC